MLAERIRESKTFSLRNVDSSVVTTCGALKSLIRAQLCSDIDSVFDVGYQLGNSVINIRSADDLREVWSSIQKGTKIVLWCDGLKVVTATQGTKRQSTSVEDESDDDDQVSRKKDNEDKEKEERWS